MIEKTKYHAFNSALILENPVKSDRINRITQKMTERVI